MLNIITIVLVYNAQHTCTTMRLLKMCTLIMHTQRLSYPFLLFATDEIIPNALGDTFFRGFSFRPKIFELY